MLVFSKVFIGNLHVVKRPVSLAISCWFLIIGSLSALVSAYLGRNDPAMLAGMAHSVIPAEVQYAILLFSQGITLVVALAMLQRQRGARTVYLLWGVIDIAFCLVTVPLKMHVLPGTLTFAVICAFLYSPKSNAWFSPRKAANDACMTPA
ncbi:hypothetical protein CSZ94_15525 [Janthinobacterium sp. ROICE36]|uniref:hypothetical protein n=1 Tax=Janthinobacterium sp. ROICE36 TaxID=2048670 RepID=UPI000C7F5886|nr:hypothetical protein [Janthinobacterium sp. ROICE36]PLY41438.1 hypothetical protein CSZ94_15525 [Janthinobacterium sp. ROICE36]